MEYLLKYRFFILLSAIIFFSSCASKKDILYLQDIESYNAENDSTFNDIKIQKNDLLSISVSATDQKSAVPFNLPVVASSSGISGTVSTRQEIQTYLVNENGSINFPVLGEVQVLNKSKLKVIAELKHQLLKYIKEPIVTIRITNFRISVLGEVNKPGQYSITDERVTIFQAISLAGDLNIYGKRKDILIVREKEDGSKEYAKLDITSKGIMSSPYYFLHQNDVIIVSPNNAQVQASAFNRNTSIYVSIVSALITVATFLISLN